MAQISDWISRMFNNGPAQGLSGGAEDLPLDPREAYFHGRMRRHETGDDIIESPLLLWSASSPTRRRTGLREHLLSQKADGPANFTDILVVVNEADYRRTLNQVAEPWTDTATRVLAQEFESFSRQEGYQLPFASRGIRFRIIRDGGQEMGHNSMGLIKGEYVTGLLPNLYAGPIRTSRPILAFHLAMPGVWEGYQEVGRMYSDQVQFTLGSHWLDSASHPALREPALYLVQQYLDGSLDPRINPDLRDRYAVSSQQTDGVDVQTISSREDGAVIAYLVVALMDSFLSDAPVEEEAEEAPAPAPAPAPASMNLGYASSRREPEPARREPLSLKAADTDVPELELDPNTRPPPGERPRAGGRSISSLGQKTIVPDAAQEQIFTLKERGALLQKVHFRKFMKGYDVYISQSGNVSTHAREPAATFQVREDKVTLVVHRPEVTVNGAKVTLNQPMPLYDRTLLMVGPHSLEYNDLTGMRVDGWPYLGEILRPAGSTHMVFGGRYRIGRDRRCKVQLPDEPHNENIVWLDGASKGSTIRARSGEIPKSRFYTDSIMVASEHAEVDLRDGKAAVNAIARHCFTFVRRGDQILPLFPTKQGGTSRLEFEDGDDLLVGNCLFHIDFGSAGAEASTGPAPALPKRLTADSLARAVEMDSDFGDLNEAYETREGPPPRHFSARERLGQLVSGPFSNEEFASSTEPATVPPDDEGADEPTEPVDPKDLALDAALSARGHRPFLEDEADLPPAHGLGERGPAPSPPKIPRGFDSLLGELPQTRTPSPGRDRGLAEQAPVKPSSLPPPQRSVGFGLSEVERIGAGELEPPEPGPTFAERPDFPTEDPFDEDEDEIIAIVNEERWQMEMARPARLLLHGWAISGEAVVGNYRECAVVVPESRSEPHQLFHAHEYFKVKVRSSRGKAQLLDPDEARMRVDGDEKRTTLEISKVEFEIIRRDADGDEDFSIMLRIDPDVELPDPRARLLAIDHSDRMAQALFTVGFPQAAKRKVRLGPVRCYGTFADGRLTLSDYLRTYRQPDGRFLPFFFRKGDGVFRTMPEDGREVVIEPGDQVLVERSLYEFKVG